MVAFIKTTAFLAFLGGCLTGLAEDSTAFKKDAAPLFRKYCLSCHNEEDREGGLSLATPEGLRQGGDKGAALLPGNAKSSRLVRMMLGQLDPKMPPDDLKGPTAKELERLSAWIDEGAKVENGISLVPQQLMVPKIKSLVSKHPITDLAWSPDGRRIAIARYQVVEILDGKTKQTLYRLNGHPGKVNSVQFSPDSKYLLAASGITGLNGTAIEWELATQSKKRVFPSHQDAVYSAVYSPDGSIVATAGYDRKIFLWHRQGNSRGAQNPLELAGHNDAIYDLQFSSSGLVLASASGDQTVKLWSTSTGRRLDTLGQPLQEQFAARFHPTQDFILGAGRDHRIRLWKFKSKVSAKINPLIISRFAHEAAIVNLAYSQDGTTLVSSAEDKTIRIWTGETIELLATLPTQSDVAYGIAISPSNELAIGRMDGSLEFYALPDVSAPTIVNPKSTLHEQTVSPNRSLGAELVSTAEIEPNTAIDQSQKINVPARVSGTLFRNQEPADMDCYQFFAQKGETWVIETNASRSQSLADTKIEILSLNGTPIPRAKFQAVRDSYFTFRGKDANTSDDFRVHNWEEMELNEYLYCNGEVVKLFLYPRGPDSGFKVYPGFGNRHNYFDTTPVAHALQEPCFVVKAYSPATKITPNGLPVFTLNYENDDDAERKIGSDSKLYFTSPADSSYVVRIQDSRGFQGEKYSYTLDIRSAKPDFAVGFSGKKITLKRGSGREFNFKATRFDRFKGKIDILIEQVPEGITMPEKITIQENHYQAFGTCHVALGAKQPTPDQIKKIKFTAIARIHGKEVRKDLGNIEELLLQDSPRIQARVVPSSLRLTPSLKARLFTDDAKPIELIIRPGQTISANLVVQRNQHDGDIDFGNAESGRNLPHGVFVDNIGLNGLRIIKGQGDVREFFITAAKWVPQQQRLFHLRANNIDGETTLPVLLRVK
ncbi:MAG: c-type cytochrome domain-containing protein [Planctomycetota bacterium]|nr:c-type cytochrome domain-containing protein [Planctomycetota bacterium]